MLPRPPSSTLFPYTTLFRSHGQITLGAEIAPPHLHIWVRDTGTGIPAELQERIFEPFATLEQTKRRGEGIGLGLRSEEHTSELQSQSNLVCRLLLEKKKKNT